jgi:hypothetical protein
VRAAIDFGGAVTPSDLRHERLCVDRAPWPTDKPPARARDPPPKTNSGDETSRRKRLYEARRDLRGRIRDIEA